jgi:GxxExxY protein
MTGHRDTEGTEMNKYDGFAVDTTDRIIACAIEVHRQVGPGLLESVYEHALCVELSLAGLKFRRQVGVPVTYKGELIAEHRPDLVVADLVVVEVKSVERFHPVFMAQMLTYLQITGLRVGLILNFNRVLMRDGIKRVML